MAILSVFFSIFDASGVLLFIVTMETGDDMPWAKPLPPLSLWCHQNRWLWFYESPWSLPPAFVEPLIRESWATLWSKIEKNTDKIAIQSFTVPRAREWAKWVSSASELANGRASGPVQQSVFLAVIDHNVLGMFASLGVAMFVFVIVFLFGCVCPRVYVLFFCFFWGGGVNQVLNYVFVSVNHST